MIAKLRLVALDTATWGILARDKSDVTGRVIEILSSGAVIPFFTSTHLEELTQHENAAVVKDRIRLLRQLPFVSYLACSQPEQFAGSVLDLRERELAVLCRSPWRDAEAVVGEVQDGIANGFCSGAELCNRHEDFWEIWKSISPDLRSSSAKVTSLVHFALPGVDLQQRNPRDSAGLERRSRVTFFEERAPWLEDRLRKDGDKRLGSISGRSERIEDIARDFMRECYQDLLPLSDAPGDIVEILLASAGVDRARLPENATVEDVGCEATFLSHLGMHERRLNLPPGTLKQVCGQENVPSWIVWREVDRGIKRLQKAEGSSLNDKLMIAFALYLDLFEADKRICECVRQAAQRHILLRRAAERVFRHRSLEHLELRLRDLSPDATDEGSKRKA